MKILADSAIEKHIENGCIAIDGDLKGDNFQPNSIDLNLGGVCELVGHSYHDFNHPPFDDAPDPVYRKVKPENGEYRLPAGHLYFLTTEQKLGFQKPVNKVHISPRSTFARAGIQIIPLSGREYYWIDGPFNGKIQCSFYSNCYDISLKKGQRIVQALFFVGKDRERKILKFHSDRFLIPKPYDGFLDLSKGINDSELYEDVTPNNGIMQLSGKAFFRSLTKEKVDYSDGKHAALMLPHGGMAVGNGWVGNCFTGMAPHADAGYSGNLSAFFDGPSFLNFTARGLQSLVAYEFPIEGEVNRLYGSKKLGSHYKMK